MRKAKVKVEVIVDLDKLDVYARSLYGPGEEVPGEPHPGDSLIEDWVWEASEAAKRGEPIDLYWTGDDAVIEVTVSAMNRQPTPRA